MADIIYQDDGTGKYIAGIDPATPENQDFPITLSVLKIRRKGRASATDWVLADIREAVNEQDQIEFDKAVEECAENFFDYAPPSVTGKFPRFPRIDELEY